MKKFVGWVDKPSLRVLSEHKDKKQFISKFEEYVRGNIEEKIESLWETKRLKELLIMLHYETGKKLEKENKSDYIELPAFKNRSILPKASQVAEYNQMKHSCQEGWHKKA
jgi:hypothetical protein